MDGTPCNNKKQITVNGWYPLQQKNKLQSGVNLSETITVLVYFHVMLWLYD